MVIFLGSPLVIAQDKEDKQKKQQKDEQALEEEMLEDADFPDLVPADDKGEFIDELDDLQEDDFPDLVRSDETGDFMDELDFLQDAEMVELAARHRQDIGQSPSAITVFTREDIETTGATNVIDLLRQVPGQEVVHIAPYFSSITGRVNWNYENNTHQVLIDGREFKQEALGFAPWPLLPVFLDDIERIEVIRGPASSLYGADAMAGVISITTRTTGKEGMGGAYLEMGEAGTLTAAARASYRPGNWGFSLQGGADRANRWLSEPRTPGKEIWKVRATAEYRLSEKEKLYFDGSAAGGTGIIPSTAGELNTDYYEFGLLARYRSENLTGHVFFNSGQADGVMRAPLKFAGVTLAEITRNVINGSTLMAEGQWTLPLDLDSLMIIVGGGGRYITMDSPQLLDELTFSDINSPQYHLPGLDYWEIRAGGFVHVEYTPIEWLTLTGSLRLDYNTATGEFLSPRVAAVIEPFQSQYLRMGVARSFRKPTSWEYLLHVNVEFPEGGIFVGSAKDDFREFMTRVVGNVNVDHEKLTAFEVGYLGKFADDKLAVALDLYYNLYEDQIFVNANIVPHEQYLVDLELSSFRNENTDIDHKIFGSELSLRYQPARQVMLKACWATRAVLKDHMSYQDDMSPKNLITLGGRFITDLGLLGSLYLHSTSKHKDRTVDNPAGILEPRLSVSMPTVVLLLARLGFRWKTGKLQMESGVKLFLPISPFEGPTFRMRDRGGGLTPFGEPYGGDQLTRVISVYLKASPM